MVGGFLAWIISEWLYPRLSGDVIGLACALLTIAVVTPLSQAFDPPRPLIDEYGNPIPLGKRLGTLPLFSSSKKSGASGSKPSYDL